jgi:hypothetical protein
MYLTYCLSNSSLTHISIYILSILIIFPIMYLTYCLSNSFTLTHLISLGIDRNHFSHVFVDEAGQATEPGME